MSPCARSASRTASVLAAAVAGDAHEPRRERPERLVQGFRAGRQRVVAVAAPVPPSGSAEPASGARGRIIRAKNAFTRASAAKRFSSSGRPAPGDPAAAPSPGSRRCPRRCPSAPARRRQARALVIPLQRSNAGGPDLGDYLPQDRPLAVPSPLRRTAPQAMSAGPAAADSCGWPSSQRRPAWRSQGLAFAARRRSHHPLGHGRPDVQHERSGGRHVGRDERDAGLHQPGDEVDVAGQPVELGRAGVDHQLPCVGELEQRAGDGPHENHADHNCKSVGPATLTGCPLRGLVEHGADTVGRGRSRDFLRDAIRSH